MTEKMQVRRTQRRKAVFVRCCLKITDSRTEPTIAFLGIYRGE